jgi:hypothetical protein
MLLVVAPLLYGALPTELVSFGVAATCNILAVAWEMHLMMFGTGERVMRHKNAAWLALLAFPAVENYYLPREDRYTHFLWPVLAICGVHIFLLIILHCLIDQHHNNEVSASGLTRAQPSIDFVGIVEVFPQMDW